MVKKSQKYDSGCPIAYGLDVFGDQWSLLIIRDMALKGARTYGEFLEGWEGISTNILANRLKHLEDTGLITRERDPDNWRSYIYELTPKGRDLAPVIAEIILWSGKYNTAEHAMPEAVEKVRRDRQGFEDKVRNGDIP
ncbi:winged helix-turn-helix transcriptional regulator [Roseibium sp.]|uniref:winged helix-turn-helix transcriptional regulator n=1 Tax=Roseibium sp. TaxID=1936156 RepID=UPI003A971C35